MTKHDPKEAPPIGERRDNSRLPRNARVEHHPDGLKDQPRGAGTYGFEPNPRQRGAGDADAPGGYGPGQSGDGNDEALSDGTADAAPRSVSGTASPAADADSAPRPAEPEKRKR